MYVYLRSEPQLWTVGFYTPNGEWIPESDYDGGWNATREHLIRSKR